MAVMRTLHLGVLACLLPTSAAADAVTIAPELDKQVETLSIVDVFKVAVRTSPALEHAAFDLAHADAAVISAQALEDFRLVTTGDFSRVNGAPIPPLTVGTKNDVYTLSMGLSRILPSNGTLELLASGNKTSSDGFGVQKEFVTTSVKLRLTQPLLKGFGPASQKRQILRSQRSRDAIVLRMTATADSFASNLAEAYWRLALSWRALEVRKLGVDSVQKQKKITEAAMRTGKIPGSEMIAIDAAVASREQELINAELDVVEKSLELRKLLGLPVNANAIALRTQPLPSAEGVDPDLTAITDVAVKNSPDIAAGLAIANASEAAVAGAKRDLLPRLDLRIEGGPLGTSSDDAGGKGKVRESLNRLTERSGYAFSANLQLELFSGRSAQRGGYLEERATRASQYRDVADLRAALIANVAKQVYQVRAFRAKAKLGQRGIELSQANYDAEQKKFELGKSGNNEIVRLQDELENARLRHAQNLAELVIALNKLEALSGVFLEGMGIKIKTGGWNLDDYLPKP